MAKFEDVFKSVIVHVPWISDFMSRYGPFLWCAVAIRVAVSFHQALRHGGSRRALGINLTVAGMALCLAFVAREAVWQPFMSVLQGIGTQQWRRGSSLRQRHPHRRVDLTALDSLRHS